MAGINTPLLNNEEATIMGLKETYVEEHEAQLSLWDAEIKQLEAKAETARAVPMISYYDHLRSLHIQRMTVHESLREVKQATAEELASFKIRLERDWQELRVELIRTTATFQEARNSASPPNLGRSFS